jgi:hypothetical protein
MTRILNRFKVYSLFIMDYIRHGEWSAVTYTFNYIVTG